MAPTIVTAAAAVIAIFLNAARIVSSNFLQEIIALLGSILCGGSSTEPQRGPSWAEPVSPKAECEVAYTAASGQD